MDDPPDPAPEVPTVFYGLFPRWTAAGFDDETEASAFEPVDYEPGALETAFV